MNSAPEHGDTIAAALEPTVAELIPEPKPEAPKSLTRKQLGQLRRQYMTVVHAQVVKCGHSFNPNRIPSRNCVECWEAYFKTSVDLVQLHEQITLPEGIRLITNMRGEKYVKAFKRFLDNELSMADTVNPAVDPDKVPEQAEENTV